jgi:AraC-binding-like domain
MQPADLAPRAFSTVGLPAARRVELWETHNATALIGLDVQASEPLVATELNVRLPLVDLARVAGSAHVVRRTRKVIERSSADAVAVYLTLRGDAWFECTDRTYGLHPGNVLVFETDEPFARGFSHGLEELVVKVDRAAVPEVPQLSRPVIASFRGSGADDQYARTLARLTGQATRTNRPLPADEHTVLDLIAVLATGGAAAPAIAHRAAARSYIEEHVTDPNLGAAQLRRQSGSVSGNCPGSSPRTAFPCRNTSCRAVCTSHTQCCPAPRPPTRPRPWPTPLPGAALRRRPTSPTRSASTSAIAPTTSAAGRAPDNRARRSREYER